MYAAALHTSQDSFSSRPSSRPRRKESVLTFDNSDIQLLKKKNIQCIDLTLLYLKIFIPYHPNTTIQLNKTIKTCMFWIIYVIRSVINNYNINVDLLWHDQSHYRSCNQEVTVKSSWSSTLSNSLASFANSTISKHIMKPCV